jgi:hypothetical protein
VSTNSVANAGNDAEEIIQSYLKTCRAITRARGTHLTRFPRMMVSKQKILGSALEKKDRVSHADTDVFFGGGTWLSEMFPRREAAVVPVLR